MQLSFRCLSLIVLIGCNPAFAAGDGNTKTLGKWTVECASGTCQLSTATKAGDTGFLDLGGPKGELKDFGFLVAGDVDAQHPMSFEFAHLVADKSKKGCEHATDIAKFPDCFNFDARKEDGFSGPVTACKGGMCISKLTGDPDIERQVIPRFQGFEFVLVLFRDPKGELQDRVLDIRGFKAAYDEAMKQLAQAH